MARLASEVELLPQPRPELKTGTYSCASPNHLVYIDLLERPPTRAPLHGMAVALALNVCASRILAAMETDDPRLWRKAARAIQARGQDPNWRRRPSVLDQLRGITAPLGRPRRSRQRDCPPSALPYRRPPEASPSW